MMKKKKLILGLLGGLLLGLGLFALHCVHFLNNPLSSKGGVKVVEIPRGSSYKRAVQILAQKGVVRSPLVMEWYGRLMGKGNQIKAGIFEIRLEMTPKDLLQKLEEGSLRPQIRLTVPEGYNRWQIADLLEEAHLAARKDFLNRVEADHLEGRLYPDTYFFNIDSTLDEVLKRMTARFDAVFNALIEGRNLDDEAQKKLLIMASLVEKEAKTDRDRGLCARVFYNRLAKGMKLQTDPTCVYSEQLYLQRATPAACKDPQSAYSTYVIAGLPPGPISNPGKAALKAALDPPNDKDAQKLLYFVAKQDGSGEHFFSETYEEHRKAIDLYLKKKTE